MYVCVCAFACVSFCLRVCVCVYACVSFCVRVCRGRVCELHGELVLCVPTCVGAGIICSTRANWFRLVLVFSDIFNALHIAAHGNVVPVQGQAAPTPSTAPAISYPIKNLSSLKPTELVPFYTDNDFTESVIKVLLDNMVSGAIIAAGVAEDDLVRILCKMMHASKLYVRQ